MKKFTCILATILLPLVTFAQLNGDGYYRVRNYKTQRYIYVCDNTGKINVATTSADMGAIQLWKGEEKKLSDPASIIYIQDVSKTKSYYDLKSQGTGVHQIIGYYVKVYEKSSGRYQVYAEGKYLDDEETSNVPDGKLGTTNKGDYRNWEVFPLNDTDNYFGVVPTIESNGKYYKPFYAAFPFTLSEGMKAYYVSKVYSDAAIISEISGTIPSSTPVLIECSSKTISSNKLNLELQDGTKLSGNQLKGVYFNNEDRIKSKDARTAYNASTMRILSVKDGKLCFTTSKSLGYLPANESYLSVSAGTVETLPIMTEEEYNANKYVSSIQLDKSSLNLKEAETAKLTATLLPENAKDKSVTWSSSDSNVATVDNNGLVTAINAGTAQITAKTNDGSNLTATCTVNVTEILVSSIQLNVSTLDLKEAESATLTATILPENAKNKSVTWSSSDENVATVDNNGLVTAINAGTAQITAKTNDGSNLTATCTVNVTEILVSSIQLNVSTLDLKEAESATLTAAILPENAKNKSVTWSSSDSNIATVDNNGLVTAINAGTAQITAKTNDGSNLTATCTVNVSEILVSSIQLSESTLDLKETESATLTATLLPENAKNKSVTWSSSDVNIATVDNNGLVTAIKAGTAQITATTCDGTNLSASCDINVSIMPVSSLTLDQNMVELIVENKITIIADILPTTASIKTLEWSSDNSEVASVDETGTVTALQPGTATISATTTDGSNIVAYCYITVKYGAGLNSITDNNSDNQIFNINGTKMYELPKRGFYIQGKRKVFVK